MAPFLVLHRCTISADEEYYFLARPDTYSGDIGTATGITKAAESEQDRPQIPVATLVTNAKLFRITASYKAGIKNRTIKLLCSKAKLGTVLDALKGNSYTGKTGSGTITSVRVTQKAVFSF